jgi:mannose-1-phosphate guanylyltransferase
MSTFAVVLAGGSGTRLWPLSRRGRPKQLLPLLGTRSLLQATVDRLAPVVTPDRCAVITNREYVVEVRRQLPDVPPEQVVGEPDALGTAAAVALGTAIVAARDAHAVMFVLPADHVIRPVEAFHGDLARAADAARAGFLVTFGIPPTAPETGYGYIEVGDAPEGMLSVRRVARFVEKPSRAVAARYLASGCYLWNSGMFCWSVPSITRDLGRFLPALAAHVADLTAEAKDGADALDAALARVWPQITDRTTIDYGVMERSDRVVCVPATFTWSDVGSWEALGDILPADADGNVVVGRHLGDDTRRCIMYAPSGRLVATVGLSDIVIVDTPDALLVCPRDRAQDVRAIVAALKARSDPLLD